VALPTLYELSEEYVALTRDILEAEGELTPTLMERWAQLQGDLATKTQNTAMVVLNYALAATTIDTEIKRLQALKKQATNGENRVREYLKRCLISMGIKSVPCATMQVSVANNPSSVVIDNENEIPSYFKSVNVAMPLEVWRRLEKKLSVKDAPLVHQEVIVHKSAIADALRADQAVPGAHFEQGTSLRIK